MADEKSGVVELSVTTTSTYDKKGTGTLRVHRWSDQDRTSRAMKRLAMFWGGALLAAVVPPHFPWLILGGLAGIVTAWFTSRSKGTLEAGTLACPDCNATVDVEEQPEEWPLNARCKECGNFFVVALQA